MLQDSNLSQEARIVGVLLVDKASGEPFLQNNPELQSEPVHGLNNREVENLKDIFTLSTTEKNEIIVDCLETILDTNPDEIDKIFKETATSVEPYLDNTATVEEIRSSLIKELNSVEEEYKG